VYDFAVLAQSTRGLPGLFEMDRRPVSRRRLDFDDGSNGAEMVEDVRDLIGCKAKND